MPNYLTPDFETERTRSEDETGYVAVTFHPRHGGILVTVGEDHQLASLYGFLSRAWSRPIWAAVASIVSLLASLTPP